MRAPAVEVPRARESYCVNCAWSRGGSGTGRVGTVVVPLASWNESNVGRRSSRALLGAVADRLGMMRRGAAAVRGLLLGGSFCACPCPETEYNLGDDGGTYGGSSLRIVGIKRPFLSNMDFTVEVCLCGGTSTSPHINSRALTFSQVGLAGSEVLPSLTKVTTIFGETCSCFACKPSVLRFHARSHDDAHRNLRTKNEAGDHRAASDPPPLAEGGSLETGLETPVVRAAAPQV